MSTAATCRSPRRACRSRIAPSSSATASMKSAWCASGALIDEARHLARLERRWTALRIAAPVGEAALRRILREVVARNRVRDGLVYLQISRGAARRDHGFPAAGVAPGLVVTAKSLDPARRRSQRRARRRGDHACRTSAGPHPHIKIAATAAQRAGQAGGARGGRLRSLVRRRDGFVTEGASTNAWIVAADGVAGHAAGRPGDPARGHPLDAARHRRGRRPSLSRSARSPARRPMARAKPSFPARRPSPCRSSPSTAGRSATASPGPDDPGAAAKIHRRGGAQLKGGIPAAETARWRIAAEMI